jgi:hypothetical protein
MSYPCGADALVGVSLGAKVGLAEYGGDVLPSSGDVGGGTGWGLVLGFGALPVVDLEVRASYFSKDFNYTYDAGGVPVSTSFRFEDAGAIALLKANLFSPPGAPFGFYVGAGAGLHWLNTELAVALAQGTTPPSDVGSLGPFLQTTAKPSGIGVAGVRVSPPMFPLSIFGEASYERIFATEALNVTQFAVGLMLRF